MKFEKGDIVLIGNGKVHWEVYFGYHPSPASTVYVIVSGMSGRQRTVFEHELKPWIPGA